jgi:hypothetical protein
VSQLQTEVASDWCCLLDQLALLHVGEGKGCREEQHMQRTSSFAFWSRPLRRAYGSQQPAEPPCPLLPPQLGGTIPGLLELRDVKFGEFSSAPVENLRGMGSSRRRFPREVSSEADADLVWRRETSSGALPFFDEMRS